jgi:hypothetical protein
MTGILEVNTAVEENPMPVISGSMAILSGNRMLAGVDTSTMREVWRVPGLFRETPAVVNDIVYVLSLGELVRVELATGEPIPGSFSPPLGFPLGQPVVSNDRVFLTTVSGDPTYVLKRSDLTLVETLPEGGAVSLCDGYVAITGWKDGIHQVSVYAVNRPPGFLEAPGQQAIAGNYYHSLIRVESGGDGTVEPAAIHLHDGPDWLSLEDFGDGTASLTGMPPIAAAGDYPYSIEIVPQNGAPARRFLVLTVVPGSGSVPVGEIYRILTRRDGSVIIEFSAEEGEHIDLEYSDDLRQWKRSPESFEPGNPRTFRDSGPPVTESHPASAATRYYRAVRVEP